MPGAQLARYPLFGLLSRQQLDDWLAAGQEAEFAAGETIFQENSPGAWVYLVRAGRVRIVRRVGPREITVGTLLPGDVFGEYALVRPGRNTATCRTSAPARLLCLPLAPLGSLLQGMMPVWSNLKNWLRLHTLLHFRRERAFLGFMSAESALKLLDRLKPMSFAAGQTIQATGLAADTWHLIEQGTVRLHPSDPDAAGVDLGPGEMFGERALIGPADLPVATALTDVRCQVLARQDFDPTAPLWSKVVQSYLPQLPARPKAHVWVPQLGPTDCGLAALAMVSLRLEAPVSVEELRAKVALGPQGLTLQQMEQLGPEFGLACQAARVSADRLRQVSLPAIALLRDGHYVVLHELGARSVVIGDPASGIVTWHIDFLAERYSGSLALFDRPAE
jgi:CRP-like cAMP-binding protein